MRALLLTTILLLLTGTTSSGAELQVNEERAVIIQGVIYNNLDNVSKAALELFRSDSSKPIDLIINSPGGSVSTGFQFVNEMQDLRSKGAKFRCFVPGMAASMAFQILVQCDERHTLDRSFLLWHRVRVTVGGILGGPMTGPQAHHLGMQLLSIDRVILGELYAALKGVPRSVILSHFNTEMLHTGSSLAALAPKFSTTHTYIKGLYNALRNPDVPRSPQVRDSILDNLQWTSSNNDIMYIWQLNK